MLESFQAPGAAESDASVRLRIRSHVPGMRRHRAQAEEAGIKKAKPSMRLLPRESADGLEREGWNSGIVEWWNNEGTGVPHPQHSSIPTFHHSVLVRQGLGPCTASGERRKCTQRRWDPGATLETDPISLLCVSYIVLS